MREISPAENADVEEYLHLFPEERDFAERVRKQKLENKRPFPSSSLLDPSQLLTPEIRRSLLDKIAELVDENLVGRSDMCQQFAQLLALALKQLGLNAVATSGCAIYFRKSGSRIWDWEHAWVIVENEVVDGNVDILSENPAIPQEINVRPYWGPLTSMPKDRKLRKDLASKLKPDTDVENIWWPELKEWIVETHPQPLPEGGESS